MEGLSGEPEHFRCPVPTGIQTHLRICFPFLSYAALIPNLGKPQLEKLDVQHLNSASCLNIDASA